MVHSKGIHLFFLLDANIATDLVAADAGDTVALNIVH